MNTKPLIIVFVGVIILAVAAVVIRGKNNIAENNLVMQSANTAPAVQTPANPLNIDFMRTQKYPGSDIKIEETLADGAGYHQYVASYLSDGLRINGLLTVPSADVPNGGWPVIIFNHGYIPPEVYRTTQRYIAYVDYFARNGYVVFKPDYRGNGSSQGQPEGAYYSPAYTIDVLNALSSVKKLNYVNTNKIGMWGHSMGGNITFRSLEISPDIKAAVIWGGVVGSYNDLMNNWHRSVPYQPSQRELTLRNRYRQNIVQKYGTPAVNPEFWQSIDPAYHLSLITAPIQLDAGGADEEVPVAFSENLKTKLEKAGKTVEFYTYPGDDHNISNNLYTALQRSLEFFDKYLK